jgi:SAM-dependent methyltransferase
VTAAQPPLGAAQLLSAAGAARSVLDLGCGGGRLTVMLAAAGADVTGADTSAHRLADLRAAAAAAGVRVRAVEADMNEPLPFADGAFAGGVSRLSLMIARDPAATLRELRRVVAPGGPVATAVWARPERNPWFCEPRAAVAAALGAERAAFARVFGRLGELDELEAVHRQAGLTEVRGESLTEIVAVPTAAAHWEHLTRTIGHYRRLAETLTPADARLLADELERRLEPYRRGAGLELERTMLVVTARTGDPG